MEEPVWVTWSRGLALTREGRVVRLREMVAHANDDGMSREDRVWCVRALAWWRRAMEEGRAMETRIDTRTDAVTALFHGAKPWQRETVAALCAERDALQAMVSALKQRVHGLEVSRRG